MQIKLNLLVLFISIILFLWEANSKTNSEDLNVKRNEFYRRPRFKRSPECSTDVIENSVDNNGRKCVDNREKIQIENIQTNNNLMANSNEIINDFYFDEELFDECIKNCATQWPQFLTSTLQNILVRLYQMKMKKMCRKILANRSK